MNIMPQPGVFHVDAASGLFINPRTKRAGLPVPERPSVRPGSAVSYRFELFFRGLAWDIPAGARLTAALRVDIGRSRDEPFYSAPALRIPGETGALVAAFDLKSPSYLRLRPGTIWFTLFVDDRCVLADKGRMDPGVWGYPLPATPYQETPVTLPTGTVLDLRPVPTIFHLENMFADEREREVAWSDGMLADGEFYDCNRIMVFMESPSRLVFPGAAVQPGRMESAGWWIYALRRYPDGSLGVFATGASSSEEGGSQGPPGPQGPAGVDGQDGITPHIGINGNWWVGDIDTLIQAQGPPGQDGADGAPGASGAPGQDGADGTTPHIGVNGNWWIGETDTEMPARGPAGQDGADGAPGAPGKDGEDGQDGADGEDGTTPHIGANGNWWIGDEDTEMPARGPAGQDGADGADGQDGADGLTPHIGVNGNWWIGETDTEMPARGPAGVDGRDGEDGAQGPPGQDGEDGAPGAPGKDGADGADGADGLTPYIGANGNWWIGETDTEMPARGPAGQDTFPVVYTNASPSTVAAGGIAAGSVFNEVTFPEFVEQLLYAELFPVLSAPSLTFKCNVSGFREIGETILSVVFTATFDRGSISPQYQSDSPFRSGSPIEYQYTGAGLSTKAATGLADQQTLTDYVVAASQSWTCKVSYGAGAQPKGSKGTDYGQPLAAGTTPTITASFSGVYPYFATTSAIDTLTKQSLASMSSTYVETAMIGEADINGITHKQAVSFPVAWKTITGIQFLNTVSNQWEWLGGSKTNSLGTFTSSNEVRSIQNNSIDYKLYTHNGSFIGARKLRWYTN